MSSLLTKCLSVKSCMHPWNRNQRCSTGTNRLARSTESTYPILRETEVTCPAQVFGHLALRPINEVRQVLITDASMTQ
jgi:hypothetical protein